MSLLVYEWPDKQVSFEEMFWSEIRTAADTTPALPFRDARSSGRHEQRRQQREDSSELHRG